MSQPDFAQLLEIYQKYRYQDQVTFYQNRHKEFTKAETQATILSIGLIGMTALGGALQLIDVTWVKYVALFAAAICPVLFTALAAYRTLYGFEEQAKLYHDTIHNLRLSHEIMSDGIQGLNEAEFAEHLKKYIDDTESIFLKEQGQWGQLAKDLKPPETLDG
jgi:hypothetical protein